MPLDIPETSEEVIQRAKTDVRRALLGSNPFLKNSAISALIIGYANRVFDFYLQLKIAIAESFPDTATGIFLEAWAAIFGIIRLAATQSSGNIIAIGNVGGFIPASTLYSTTDGVVFVVDTDATIIANTDSVTTITRVGNTATVTTDDPHNLASNVPVTITGAVELEYNEVDTLIQVTGLNTFTYEVTGNPSSPATGTIFADHISIPVTVTSQEFQDSENDVNVNLSLDTPLGLQSPIVNVNDNANVDFSAVGGGADQENDPALRLRMLTRIQNPVANFNVAAIDEQARLVNGVTRVFVQEITPAIGQVTTYFMRDDDEDPIPTPGEVTDVKDSILLIKPANTATADVIVLAPVGVTQDFTFSSLTPNTASMQTAITANLGQFFKEEPQVGVTITEEKYVAAIQNTIDSGGNSIDNFALSDPIGDIPITTGQIGLLGVVSYP